MSTITTMSLRALMTMDRADFRAGVAEVQKGFRDLAASAAQAERQVKSSLAGVAATRNGAGVGVGLLRRAMPALGGGGISGGEVGGGAGGAIQASSLIPPGLAGQIESTTRGVLGSFGRLRTGAGSMAASVGGAYRDVMGEAGAMARSTIGNIGSMAGGTVRAVTSMTGSIVSAIPKLAMLTAGLMAVAGAAGALASKLVSGNASYETFTAQFKVLLGDLDQAKARMAELENFANITPFELTEVASASRMLQTLTKGALSAGDGLRMVGDAAAYAQRPYDELALLIGRVYSGIQAGGGAIGYETMRLMELGLVSGETKRALNEMTQSGLSSAEAWRLVTKDLAITKGMMEEMSSTFSGLASNARDSIAKIARTAMAPLFEQMKASLQALTSPASQEAMQRFAEQFATGFDAVLERASGMARRASAIVLEFGPSLLAGVVDIWRSAGPVINSVLDGLLIPTLREVGGVIVRDLLPAARDIVAVLGDELPPVIAAAASVWRTVLAPAMQLVGSIIREVTPVITGTINYISEHMLELSAILLTRAVPAIVAFGISAKASFLGWAASATAAATASLAALVPFLPAMAAVALAVGTLKLMWDENLLGIRYIAEGVGQTVVQILQVIGDKLRWLGDSIGGWLSPVTQGLRSMRREMGEISTDAAQTAVRNITEGLQGGQLSVEEAAARLVGKLNLKDTAGMSAQQVVDKYLGTTRDGLTGAFGTISPLAEKLALELDQSELASAAGLKTRMAFLEQLQGTAWQADLSQGAETVGQMLDPKMMWAKIISDTSKSDPDWFSDEDEEWARQLLESNYNRRAAIAGYSQDLQGQIEQASTDLAGAWKRYNERQAQLQKEADERARTERERLAKQRMTDLTRQYREMFDATYVSEQEYQRRMEAASAQYRSFYDYANKQSDAGSKDDAKSKLRTSMEAQQSIARTLADTIRAVSESMRSIRGFRLPENFDSQVTLIAQTVDTMMLRLQAVSLKYKAETLDLMDDFARTSNSLAQSFLANFELFERLEEAGGRVLSAPERLASMLTTLSERVTAAMSLFRSQVREWDIEATETTRNVAETGAALAGMLASFYKLFEDMVDDGRKVLDPARGLEALAVQLVGQAVSVARYFAQVAPAWEEVAAKAISDAAGATGSVGQALSTMYGLLRDISDGKGVPTVSMASLYRLSDMLVRTAEDFRARVVGRWAPEMMAIAAELAGYAQAIVGALGDGLSLITGLVDFEEPTRAAVDRFLLIFAYIVTKAVPVVARFDLAVTELAGQIGQTLQNLMGGLSGAVEVLRGLPTLAVVPESFIEDFFAGLGRMISAFARRSGEWAASLDAERVELAENIGKAMQGISAAVGIFDSLRNLRTDLTGNINLLFDNLRHMIALFSVHSARWRAEMDPTVVQVATDMQAVMDGLNAALDPINKIEAAAMVDTYSIDQAIANVDYTLHRLSTIMSLPVLQGSGLAQMQRFSGQIGGVFGALREMVEATIAIGDARDSVEGGDFAYTLDQFFLVQVPLYQTAWETAMDSMAAASERFALRTGLSVGSLPQMSAPSGEGAGLAGGSRVPTAAPQVPASAMAASIGTYNDRPIYIGTIQIANPRLARELRDEVDASMRNGGQRVGG